MDYPLNMKSILQDRGSLTRLISSILDMSLVSKEWSETQYSILENWMRRFGYTDDSIQQMVEWACSKNFYGDHNWNYKASKLQVEKLEKISRIQDSRKEWEARQPKKKLKLDLN